YVANDFGRNNLYRNDGGRFHDVAAAAGVEDIGAGMSVSWGDYDNDGWMDLYVGNMFSAVGRRLARQEGFHKDASETTRMQFQRHARGNSLYHNNGDGTFSDVSESAGVTMGRWAWDSRFVDVDNNGWEDLFVANGYFTRDDPEDLHDFFWRGIVSRSPNGAGDDRRDLDRYAAAWRSLGRMIRAGRSLSGHERDSFFLNIGGPRFAFAPAALGLDFPDDGRAVAVGDWDLDGDLDLWVVNRTGPRVRFVRNDAGRTNRFVAFRLQGASGNRDAIGARLELRLPGGARRIRTLHAGAGYLSQSSKWVHFGLGDASGIERLVVDWPGGSRQEFDGVEPDHFYRITQGQAGARVWIPPERPAPPPPAREPVTPSADRSSIIFSEPVPSPILRYEDLQGRDVEYDGASSDPLLVGLWATRCAACAEQLGRFVARAGDLKAAGVRVLALNVDEFVGTTTATPAVDRELLDAFGRVFEAGRAKGALLDKIALLQRHLLASPSRLPVPSSLLIDRQGFLAAIYKGPVPIDRFLADLPALSTPGEKRLAKAIPFTGLRQTRGMPPFFEAMDAVARAYADGGFPEEAVAYYRKVLRIKPDRTRTHFDLADLLAGMGKTSEAIEQYRATLALDPNHLASLNNLGYLLARQGRTDQAVVMYRRALSIDSDNVSTLDNLAAALRTQGKTEEAITLYRKALRIDPDRATSLNNLAVALARQGHEEEALALYRRLLVQDADNVAARINLAMALIRQEKIPEAVDLLQAAVEKNPDSPEARYYLGFALLQQGRPEAAAEHLGQAVRLKPGYVRALYYLAIALAKRGDLDEAAGAFAAALQLQADDPAASLRLARLLATHQDAAMRDGSRAVQMARRVPEGTVSSRVEYLDTLAAALAEAGRFDEAVETAGEAVDAAERTGDAALAGQIRDRLQLYRRRHPYHDPPPDGAVEEGARA
ncbi:MAG: tetratricopeptide repeat protein, partial [Acidobacteriota bacterium]